MKFIKKNGKYIGIVIMCVFCSYLTTLATNYIFDSGDVRFDNIGTSLESVNVQDAIDETFHHVTDYNDIKTTIGNSSLTTTSNTLIGAINEVNSNLKVKLQSINANSVTETSIIRTTSGSTNLPSSTNVEGMLVSYISYIDGAYVGVQYFTEYATNKDYTRLLWYGTWRPWQELASNSNVPKLRYQQDTQTPNSSGFITLAAADGTRDVVISCRSQSTTRNIICIPFSGADNVWRIKCVNAIDFSIVTDSFTFTYAMYRIQD